MKKWLDKYKSKGEVKNSLNRTVTCSNCGWSWKLSDGGEDPLTCHKCGGTIKMKHGGELDKYKEKGEVKQSFRDQLLERSGPIVDASAAPIVSPSNLRYDKTRVVNGPSAGLTKTQLKNVYQHLKNRAEQEKKQKLEEYKAAKLFHENNPVAKVLGTRKPKPTTVKPTTRELLSGLGAGINNFYDLPDIGIANDFVNPLSLVSKGIISPWAQAPLQAQQSDSYLPYLGAAVSTALTVPMVRPASIAAKTFLNPRNIYTDALKTNAFLNRGIKNKKIIPETNIVEIPKNKENVKSLTDRLSEMLFEPEEKKSFGNMITDEIETNNFVKNYNKNFKKRYKDYSDFKKEYTDFYNEQVNVFGRTPEEVDPEGIMKDFSNPDYLNDVLGFNTYPNARRNIARGLTGDYRGAYYNNQLDNGGRQLLPERGEGIFKLSADNFGKYEQAKPWEVFDKNHFIRQNKYGGQWLDEYKEKGEVKSTFNPYANVNRIGTSDNTRVYRVNPDQVEKAKEAAAIKNEKIVQEYQQNQRSFIGPDKRTKDERNRSIASRKAYDDLMEKQQVMKQQPIYQFLQNTTPGGYNPNAAYNPVIGNTAEGLGYMAAGALGSSVARPAFNFMGQAMNAPIQGVAGLTGNNIVNSYFATHGLKSIGENIWNGDGNITRPWKEAIKTGNSWDYANAVGENAMTVLELAPLVGPGYRGALTGIGTRNTGQFVNNLVNPLAGMGSKEVKVLQNVPKQQNLQYNINGLFSGNKSALINLYTKELLDKGLPIQEVNKQIMNQFGITAQQAKAGIPILRDILYKGINPRGTSFGPIGKLLNMPFNLLRFSEFSPAGKGARDDAWRLFLGKGQKANTFIPTLDLPVEGIYDPKLLANLERFNIADFDKDKMISNILSNSIGKKGHFTPEVLNKLKTVGKPAIMQDIRNDIMGGFNMVRPEPNLLQYNDIWDLNVPGLPNYITNNILGKKFLSTGTIDVGNFKQALLEGVKNHPILKEERFNKELVKYINNNFQKGGVIEDDMGQWAHPGQVTRINSNEITMEGVPYPVLGVDNTGYTKVMQPGMNYTFPGQYVTEYPMAQNGKEVKKDNIRQAYIDAYNNYSKRKFPAETLPIRQKAFRTVNPSSYLDFQNYNRWNRDEQRDVFYDPRSEEAWNFYLGLSKPEDLKYIRKSQYRPTINATDQNYYALDPELEQDIFNTFKDKVILNKTLQTDEGKVNTRLSGKNGAGALGRFGVSRGHDENGDYLSYYDKYDLKDFAQDEAKGMPYSIYNRIYYPKKQYGGQNTDWEIIG